MCQVGGPETSTSREKDVREGFNKRYVFRSSGEEVLRKEVWVNLGIKGVEPSIPRVGLRYFDPRKWDLTPRNPRPPERPWDRRGENFGNNRDLLRMSRNFWVEFIGEETL